MIAVDTNILVRLLTGDDRRQTASAKALFASERIWIAKTVLMETAWVLRKAYGVEDDAIRRALSQLLGLKQVSVEDEAVVTVAFQLAGQGLDFADALHLSSRPPGAHFVTFDRAMVRRAKRAGQSDVKEPPAPPPAP